MSKVMLRSEFTLSELAYEISRLPTDEVKEFVKELDGLMEDYDFTKALLIYFTKEMKAEGYTYRPKPSKKKKAATK